MKSSAASPDGASAAAAAAPACRENRRNYGGKRAAGFSRRARKTSIFSKNCPSVTSEKRRAVAPHCRAATFLAESPLESSLSPPNSLRRGRCSFLLRDAVRGDATDFGQSAVDERKGEVQHGSVSNHRLRIVVYRLRREDLAGIARGRSGLGADAGNFRRHRRGRAGLSQAPIYDHRLCRRRDLRAARHPARLGGRLRLPARRACSPARPASSA